MNRLLKVILVAVLALMSGGIGCANRAADLLNPYAVEPENELGQRDNKAILGESGESGNSEDRARHALEVMASYRRSQDPQPTNPVVRPAEVRLMWIPDHLNKAGDLVPAHYYYLRVLNDRWAVQDAFEFEQQLNSGVPGAGGATPWVYQSK